MRLLLTHPVTGGKFTATSQRQVDRLTQKDREGGAWEVADEQGKATADLADSHTREDLLALAEAAGVEVPAKSSKAQIAALVVSSGSTEV